MASDPHPDSPPETEASPDSAPATRDDDARSDIEQAVDSRGDAVGNGEGGDEPDGLGGAGGGVRDQTTTEQ